MASVPQFPATAYSTVQRPLFTEPATLMSTAANRDLGSIGWKPFGTAKNVRHDSNSNVNRRSRSGTRRSSRNTAAINSNNTRRCTTVGVIGGRKIARTGTYQTSHTADVLSDTPSHQLDGVVTRAGDARAAALLPGFSVPTRSGHSLPTPPFHVLGAPLVYSAAARRGVPIMTETGFNYYHGYQAPGFQHHVMPTRYPMQPFYHER